MISPRERGELARFYTVTDSTKHKKGYTVYKVTARIISRKNPEDVQEVTVWKRYSDFKKLHRDLWQIHREIYGHSELFPPFAKAKIFEQMTALLGCTECNMFSLSSSVRRVDFTCKKCRFDDSVIEERRQCSEDLLQFSANIPALYGSQYIQDFFKGGEVQDSSDLIGPAEVFSDFLADSVSEGSSEVPKDIVVDDLIVTNLCEHNCCTGVNEQCSLVDDRDFLAGVDDGMASGSISPDHTARGSSFSPVPQSETFLNCGREQSSRTSAALTFAPNLQNCTGKSDYLEKASTQIALAVQKEVEEEFSEAFSYYCTGVDLLLQGVQGEASTTKRDAVKLKTAEYLMRAELISAYVTNPMGQSSIQKRVLHPQCCQGSWAHQTHSDELIHYRVLGVIDKVLLVMDKRTQETFILKGLRKSSECGHLKKTVIPHYVPNMVRLETFIISEDSIFLLLQYAEGGKLWSHICKYLHSSSPDESFDIPFIQKAHTTVVYSAKTLSSALAGSSSVDSQMDEGATCGLPKMSSLSLGESPVLALQSDSNATSEEECTNSYLMLCNEYEQEKVEPEVLGMEEDAEKNDCNRSVKAVTPKLHHRFSVTGSNSLCSPVLAQELRFFTEGEQSCSLNPSKYLSSPLDQLKQSLDSPHQLSSIDLSCIDSKNSADLCKPLFIPSDVCLEVTGEPLESGEVVKAKYLSDSNPFSSESVPVISFKEAVLGDPTSCCADEGQPPDLLVNLPVVGEHPADTVEEELISRGVTLAVGTKSSPKFGKPDVLQWELEPELDLSVHVPTSPLYRLSETPVIFKTDSQTLSFSNPSQSFPITGLSDMQPVPSSQISFAKRKDVESGTLVISGRRDGKMGSELFHELDELAEVALHTRIPEALVRSWAVDMVTALDALHQEGIICRDLNPRNILLNRTGHVELTYFCCLSDVEESCDPDAVSKLYCAPEVGGITEETAACDWWSLGALLFELIVGKSLSQCHPAGISKHTSLSIPEFVSEEARSLLHQLLQYNPVERLGAGVAGVEDIKSHPFFSHVDWAT